MVASISSIRIIISLVVKETKMTTKSKLPQADQNLFHSVFLRDVYLEMGETGKGRLTVLI